MYKGLIFAMLMGCGVSLDEKDPEPMTQLLAEIPTHNQRTYRIVQMKCQRNTAMFGIVNPPIVVVRWSIAMDKGRQRPMEH